MRDRVPCLFRKLRFDSFFLSLAAVGFYSGLPGAAASISEFRIETPVAGADLHARRTVLALRGCKAPVGASQPVFRVFLDGEKIDSQLMTRTRTAKPQSWWLGLDLPDDISSEAAHRISVEAVCGDRARVATLNFTWRTRGALETALGLARGFRIRNRSDSLEWNASNGMVAWGMDSLREYSPNSEQKVLGDWLQGYHRSWAARPEKDRRVETPGDLLPGISLLGLVFDEQITPISERFKELVWFLKTQPLNASGAMDRWGASPLAWTRAKGMAAQDLLSVGVFASQAALRVQDRDLLDFAARQPGIYAQKLRDPDSGLYHQVWLELMDAPQNQGGGFNLRANGQVLYALISIAEILPVDHPARSEVLGLARDLATRVLAHQLPGGGFPLGVGSQYHEEEEVSASAWIGAALARGVRSGVIHSVALGNARKVWSYLMARVRSSGETDSLPVFDVGPIAPLARKPDRLQRDEINSPHGVGPVLLLAAELQGLGGF